MSLPSGYTGFTSYEAMTFGQLHFGDQLVIGREKKRPSDTNLIRVDILDVSVRGLHARWEETLSAEFIQAIDSMADELRDANKPPALRAFLGRQAHKKAEPKTITYEGFIVGCLRITHNPLRTVEDLGVLAVSGDDAEYRFLCEEVSETSTGQAQAGGARHCLWPIRAIYHRGQ